MSRSVSESRKTATADPTPENIEAFHRAWDAQKEAEFRENPPEGSEGFTRDQWSRMTFGDQAYYARGGRRNPDEWLPPKDQLAIMAKALSLTPSPSIISGYRVWSYDLLDWLDRQGWRLERK